MTCESFSPGARTDVHGVAALDNLAVDFDVYREGRLQRGHGFRERFTEPEKLPRRIEARSPGTRLWPPSASR